MDASSSRGDPLCSTSFPTPRPPEANPPGDRDFLEKTGRKEGRRERSGRADGVEDDSTSSPEGHLLQQVGVHLLGGTFCWGGLLHRRREQRGGARRREEVGVILRLRDGTVQRPPQTNRKQTQNLVSPFVGADQGPAILRVQPELGSPSPPGRERTAPARCLRRRPTGCRPGRRPGCRPSAGTAGHT